MFWKTDIFLSFKDSKISFFKAVFEHKFGNYNNPSWAFLALKWPGVMLIINHVIIVFIWVLLKNIIIIVVNKFKWLLSCKTKYELGKIRILSHFWWPPLEITGKKCGRTERGTMFLFFLLFIWRLHYVHLFLTLIEGWQLELNSIWVVKCF